MDKVGIAAGGPVELWPRVLPDVSYWVGVDRGTVHLMDKGITPALAIGDFDSLSDDERLLINKKVQKVISSNPKKDDTDTELAMEVAMKEFPDSRYELIGTTGGRLDHLFSNFWLPMEPRFDKVMSNITIRDCQNSVSFFKQGRHSIFRESDKDYLGFMCLTEVKGLTLYDSKYILNNYNSSGIQIFGSNEFMTNTMSFEFDTGSVAVIQSKDN